MVALIAKRRRDFAAQRFQDKRNKPMTYATEAYMRTLVKNQAPPFTTTGCTMKHVKSISDDQISKPEFDKIITALQKYNSKHQKSLKIPVHIGTSYFKEFLSDDSDLRYDDPQIFWPSFAAWEVNLLDWEISNALHFLDKSSKYF
ncbi:hypothetical protein Tco_1137816 [Tanacetum coccineum]